MYWTVMETLTAFVRERAKWQPSAAAGSVAGKSDYLWGTDAGHDATARGHGPATDIAAVLAVILRRPATGQACEEQRARWRFNLRATDLRGADFSGAHLGGADLNEAHLEGADFTRAHLEGATLVEAHLQGADLRYAHLEGTTLMGARLQGADLTGARLQGAFLMGANLDGAVLREADLDGANLPDTDLAGAKELTQAQIDTASGDARSKLPEGLVHPAHWAQFYSLSIDPHGWIEVVLTPRTTRRRRPSRRRQPP